MDLAVRREEQDPPAEEHDSNYKCSPYIIPEVDSILSHKITPKAFLVYMCFHNPHLFTSFVVPAVIAQGVLSSQGS